MATHARSHAVRVDLIEAWRVCPDHVWWRRVGAVDLSSGRHDERLVHGNAHLVRRVGLPVGLEGRRREEADARDVQVEGRRRAQLRHVPERGDGVVGVGGATVTSCQLVKSDAVMTALALVFDWYALQLLLGGADRC